VPFLVETASHERRNSSAVGNFQNIFPEFFERRRRWISALVYGLIAVYQNFISNSSNFAKTLLFGAVFDALRPSKKRSVSPVVGDVGDVKLRHLRS
jgi:hypothetical protein